MSRATATRLRKLEAATEAARKPHIFIVEGLEADERRAQINELVAAGLAAVDQPHRFIHSRAVGAHVGLTPKRLQSGEIDYDGGVSKCGDSLYEATQSML